MQICITLSFMKNNRSELRCNQQKPNIIAIAGFDPSGGAGILADIKTISALGGCGRGVVTCATAQNSKGVRQMTSFEQDIVAHQLHSILSDCEVSAIKIGVVSNPDSIIAIAKTLKAFPKIPVVLDTVLSASANGYRFLGKTGIAALRRWLVPLAKVVTPNLGEAAEITGKLLPNNLNEMIMSAREMHKIFSYPAGKIIYLKGGHLDSNKLSDVIFDGENIKILRSKRKTGQNFHGTGCALSSAMATLIPQTNSLEEACRRAKAYVNGAILESRKLSSKESYSELNHFYKFF